MQIIFSDIFERLLSKISSSRVNTFMRRMDIRNTRANYREGVEL